jgi:hypothetical protein
LGVFDHQKGRCAPGIRSNDLFKDREGLVFLLSWRKVDCLHTGMRYSDQRCRQRRCTLIPPTAGAQYLAQSRHVRRGRVVHFNAGKRGDQLSEGMKSAIAVVGGAMALQQPTRFVARSLSDSGNKARLAHARLAGDAQQMALAASGSVPTIDQQRELGLPPDERSD